MTRTIAGVPLWGWLGGLAVFGGALWWIKRGQKAGGTNPGTGAPSQPAFSQQQEVQDFQIYSQLTQSQQASDLSFVGQMLSLFGGGSSSPARGATAGGASAGGSGGGSIGGSTAPAPTAANAAPQITPYKSSGSGVAYAPGVATQAGYVGIATGTAAGAAERSGQTLYFSPASGQFVPVSPQSNLAPNTELFLKQ